MNKLILLVFISIYTISNAQTSKTYKGTLGEGTATYQYYENDKYERVLNGLFNYNGENFDVIGHFTEGKRSGQWSISALNKIYNRIYHTTTKNNAKVEGMYENGSLTGKWTYFNSIRYFYADSKTFSEDNFEKATATFKNNHFVGAIQYESNKLKTTGSFDDLGFFEGIWNFKYSWKTDEIRYLKGVAYFRLLRNTEDGKVRILCDSTSFVKKFWNNFNQNIGISIVDNITYYPDTVDINYSEGAIRMLEENEDFQVINYNFQALNIWREYESGSFDPNAINPLYCINENYQNCNIPSCFQIIIRELEKGDKYYNKVQYKQKIADAENYERNLNYKEELKSLTCAYNIQNSEELANKISIIKNKQLIIDAESEYDNNNYSNALDLYKQSLQISFSNEIQEKINNTSKLVDLSYSNETVRENNRKIDLIYVYKEQVKKPILYNAYLIVYNGTPKYSNDIESIDELKKLINVQNKINKLVNQDTKQLEKKLKKQTEKQEIINEILAF